MAVLLRAGSGDDRTDEGSVATGDRRLRHRPSGQPEAAEITTLFTYNLGWAVAGFMLLSSLFTPSSPARGVTRATAPRSRTCAIASDGWSTRCRRR